MIDNFSSQSDKYARYRPLYPDNLFEYIYSELKRKENVWDCGTGNGQVARHLAEHFNNVYASDISESQINHAQHAPNIKYSVQPAEATNFESNQFDLIVVAQAIHWFDFERFYGEVRRTAKTNGLICVIGYGRITISKELDDIITDFYHNVVRDYWDKERKYVDDEYRTIPFPFEEVKSPKFENRLSWNFEHLIGYLSTWSAVKHYVGQHGNNPVDLLKIKLQAVWREDEIKEVCFPILIRLGRIH